MPYFNRIDHLAPPTQASFGPSASFFDNVAAAFDRQVRVDNSIALTSEFNRRYAENLARASEILGTPLVDPFGTGPGNLAEAEQLIQYQLGGDMPEVMRNALVNYPWFQQFQQNEALLRELQATNPDIKTFNDLIEDIKAMRAEVEATADSAAARGGPLGAVGQFVGGVAGSFTDPFLIASMFIPSGGGPGVSLLRKVVTDAAIGAGVEGALQFGSIQPTRELLGEAPTNPWVSIAFAGAGGAAFRGALEVAPMGYRALEFQIAPDRVRAREFARALDTAPMRISNAELLSTVRAADLNPTARAAVYALEGERLFEEANPFGNTPVGKAVARQEFENFLREFEGLPAPARAQTAVGRFMPDQMGAALAPYDTPQAMMARLREPDLYRQLDEVEARVTEAQARVDELTTFVNDRQVSDVVGMLDEVSGLRLREIETELNNPTTPRARRVELEQEADMIVQSIGTDLIAKAANDSAIKPRHQLREARRALRRERQLQSRLLTQARELEESLTFPEPPQQLMPDLGTEAVDVNSRLEAEAPTMLDRAREMVEAARVSDEDGMVSVGGVRVPEDFRFDIDEAGNSISVRQMLDDLAEDDAMLEAMRVCSL